MKNIGENLVNILKAKYKRNKKINQFLTNVKKDVLKNVPVFLAEDTNEQKNQTQRTCWTSIGTNSRPMFKL